MAKQHTHCTPSPSAVGNQDIPKAALRVHRANTDELNAAVTLLHEFFPQADIASVRHQIAKHLSVTPVADLVANVLLAQDGAPTVGHAESVSHQAGPFTRSVKLAEGSTSGSPWLTRQLKLMLSPWARSGVAVGMVSERYAP